MARELTLVDAGLGNLANVHRAIAQVGAAVQVTHDPDKVAASRAIVFPGYGAFGADTDRVVNGAMGEALKMVIQRGDPFLGISLGMQLLFDSSEAAEGAEGLHVLPGKVRRFPDGMSITEGSHERPLKVPHAGWSDVQPTGDHYYFSHGDYVEAELPTDVLWSCSYGSVTFAAAVRRDNVYGCQFHPEKSQETGLRFLRAFLLGSRS